MRYLSVNTRLIILLLLWFFAVPKSFGGGINTRLPGIKTKHSRKITFIDKNEDFYSRGDYDLFMRTGYYDHGFYKDHQVNLIRNRLIEIDSIFHKEIHCASYYSNIPKEILLSFVFVESSGNPEAISYCGAVGLIQVLPGSASDILVLEKKAGRLDSLEKAFLFDKLGAYRFRTLMNAKGCGYNIITRNDLKDPAFNLFVGATYIGLALDGTKDSTEVRMDKIAFKYNYGYFYDIKNTTPKGVLNEAAWRSKETYNYILKLMGRNGVIGIATDTEFPGYRI